MSANEKLQQYFNFTQNDLQANRQGHVAEEQRLTLKDRTRRFNSKALIVLFFVVAIGVGAALYVGRVAGGSGDFPISTAMLGPIVTVIIMTVYLVNRSRKKSDFSLQKAEGKVNFVWVEEQVRNHSDVGPAYKTVRSLQMRVGGTSFNVREELMDIVNQGDNIRFYYTGGGDIVSAEFVDKP